MPTTASESPVRARPSHHSAAHSRRSGCPPQPQLPPIGDPCRSICSDSCRSPLLRRPKWPPQHRGRGGRLVADETLHVTTATTIEMMLLQCSRLSDNAATAAPASSPSSPATPRPPEPILSRPGDHLGPGELHRREFVSDLLC